MIKFSIIIPVYNMGKSIENTVKTLLNQKYDNYEIILVDDGSKDDSSQICDELATKYKKIKTIHTINQGSGPARNCGIDIATGEYIYFPDADDLVDENALNVFAEVLKEKKYDLIVFGYKSLDSDNKIIDIKEYSDNEISGSKIRANYIDYYSMNAKYGIQGAPWNKLFKVSIIKDNNIYFPKLRRHQDDAFIGLYVSHVKNVKFINEICYSYFTNDLDKEWDKYPIDYIDCVIGLYECRKKSILTWNKKDIDTHNIVNLTYITGVIKSMELSFSPKYQFNKKERISWIKEIIKKTNIKEKNISKEYHMFYQKLILSMIKKDQIDFLYLTLNFKVIIESKYKKIFRIMKRARKKI